MIPTLTRNVMMVCSLAVLCMAVVGCSSSGDGRAADLQKQLDFAREQAERTQGIVEDLEAAIETGAEAADMTAAELERAKEAVKTAEMRADSLQMQLDAMSGDADYLSFGQEPATDILPQTGEEPPSCPPGTRRAGYQGTYYCRPLPSSSTTPDTYADTDTPQDECSEAVDLLGLNQCPSITLTGSSDPVTYQVDVSNAGVGTWPIDISDFLDTSVRPDAEDLSDANPNSYLGSEGNESFRYRVVGLGFPGIFLMQAREYDPDGTAEDEGLSSGFGFGGWLRNAHFGVQYVVPEEGDPFVVASHGGDHRGHPATLDGYTGEWRGSMVGIDKSKVDIGNGAYGALYGDAGIAGAFGGDGGMTKMDVSLTNIHDIKTDDNYPDIDWMAVPVSNGRFAHVENLNSELSGEFMRTNQIEIVGTFQHDNIGGAFGAYRQTTSATDDNPSTGTD